MFSMKILTVSALVCAMMVLTGATPVPEADPEDEQADELDIVERVYCPSGWTLINNRCFRYIPRDMTWAHAERNCQSMNANLASVHNAEEYHRIQRMISDHTHRSPVAWIGGSDGLQEGVWLWSDGSYFAFSYWCRGEPNNHGDQDCLQMNFGGGKCWDDYQCHAHLPSVCVRK